MSLYAFYIKEREGFEVLEEETGFAIYKIDGDTCYIKDIYVVPSLRKTGLAEHMADQIVLIAKEKNCKVLMGTVSPLDPKCTQNIQVLISYGFTLKRSEPNILVFTKEI